MRVRGTSPRSVPNDLRAYVGGKGVPYAPAGEGYSVRLPKQPVHTDTALSADDAPWTAIHRSVVTGPDYRVVIRVAQLSRSVTLPFGVVGALGDPRVAGEIAATDIRPVTFEGNAAYDYDGVTKEPFRGRVFRYGSRGLRGDGAVDGGCRPRVRRADAIVHDRRVVQIHSTGQRRANRGGANSP